MGGEVNSHRPGINPRPCLSQTIRCFSAFLSVFGTRASYFLLWFIFLSTVSQLTQERCNISLRILQALLGLEQNNGKFSHKNLKKRNRTQHITSVLEAVLLDL